MESNTNNALAPQKSKIVYRLLGFFLCAFGVHNFWAGHKKRAIIELVLGLVVIAIVLKLMFTEVPINELQSMAMKIKLVRSIPWIWFLIDVFTVKADGNGVPFK